MIWQDIAIGLAQLGFVVALLPTLHGSNKPEEITSLITGTGLAVLAVSFVTLGLLYSGLTAGLAGLCWFIILGQTLGNAKENKNETQPR